MKKFNINNFVIDDVFDKLAKKLLKKDKKEKKKKLASENVESQNLIDANEPIVIEVSL